MTDFGWLLEILGTLLVAGFEALLRRDPPL
jgi:hypothetical protein